MKTQKETSYNIWHVTNFSFFCYSDFFTNFIIIIIISYFSESSEKIKSLQNHVPESLFDSKTKKDFLSVLVPEMMSSEEEEEDGNGQRFFVLHKPNFRSEKLEKIMKIIRIYR